MKTSRHEFFASAEGQSATAASPSTLERPLPRLAFHRGTLILTDESHGGIPYEGVRTNFGAPFRWDERTHQWRCEARWYHVIRERLRGQVHDLLPPAQPVRWPTVRLPDLRADQLQALAAWQRAGRRGQIIMPTGTGKTVVALAAMVQCAVTTLVVAPIRDLMYQWHRRILQTLGYDAGILGDGLHRVQPVTVTTYDSAFIHMERFGQRFGLVIFDEEHHLPGQNLRQAADFCAAAWRMGLTATPERSDGRHALLDELIGPVVHRQEILQAKGKTLADYQTVRIPVALNDAEQRRYDALSRLIRNHMADRGKPAGRGCTWEQVCKDGAKDPEARRVLQAFHAKQAIETRAAEKFRVLEDLFRLHAHEQVLVFTGSNRMACEVSRRFLIPMIIDHIGKIERRLILDGFEAGRLKAIVANQVLDEGIDVPAAKVAVVLGGFASPRQATQRLGRILRRSGPTTAVLYEVVCRETREELRSRTRRKTEAYRGTRPMRL